MTIASTDGRATAPSLRTNVQQVEFHTDDPDATTPDFLAYEDDPDIDMTTLQRLGTLQVRLGVDGSFDEVRTALGTTDLFGALDRAISSLSQIREQLGRLHEEQPRSAGLCLAHGDQGQCRKSHGHEAPHRFPRE